MVCTHKWHIIRKTHSNTISIEPRDRSEVAKGFSKLSQNEKWVLSTGTVVEDKLYDFSKSCLSSHPSQSLILDINDLDVYVENKIFAAKQVQRNQELS